MSCCSTGGLRRQRDRRQAQERGWYNALIYPGKRTLSEPLIASSYAALKPVRHRYVTDTTSIIWCCCSIGLSNPPFWGLLSLSRQKRTWVLMQHKRLFCMRLNVWWWCSCSRCWRHTYMYFAPNEKLHSFDYHYFEREKPVMTSVQLDFWPSLFPSLYQNFGYHGRPVNAC